MFYVLVDDGASVEVRSFYSKRGAQRFVEDFTRDCEDGAALGIAKPTDNRTARLLMEKQIRTVAAETHDAHIVLGDIPRMPIDELCALYQQVVLS